MFKNSCFDAMTNVFIKPRTEKVKKYYCNDSITRKSSVRDIGMVEE